MEESWDLDPRLTNYNCKCGNYEFEFDGVMNPKNFDWAAIEN